MYRVVIVDDNPEFRRWFSSILGDSDNFQVVGDADSSKEAYGLVKLLTPDLLISDV